jgi:hypothetical protein
VFQDESEAKGLQPVLDHIEALTRGTEEVNRHTQERIAASVTPKQYIEMALRQAQIGQDETSRLADKDRAIVVGNAEEEHANLIADMAERHLPLNANAVETYYPQLSPEGTYKDSRGNEWQWTGHKLPDGYVREGDRYVFQERKQVRKT